MKISKIFKDFRHGLKEVVYPSACRCCRRKLTDNERFLCGDCLMNLPLTVQCDYPKEMNFVRKKFAGYHLGNCCCYFIYDKKSGYGNIVKEIKFGNDKKLGVFMGGLFGNMIADSGEFNNIDMIVPIPLHKRRLRKRGYNQSAIIAESIAEKLGVPMCDTAVERCKYTEPQSLMRSNPDRKYNMRGAFRVTNPDELNGKHILVVDDVITTGETMKSFLTCLKESGIDVRVSVAALSSVK